MQADLARALVVLAEALVSNKRVMVVGDSSLRLHDLLSELDARVVHVFDPVPDRPLAQPPPTHRGTVLRALPEGDFDVRDAAFDLAIVPDLGIVSDAAALLARLRRVVGTDGAVLCARSDVDMEGYYELYDLVALQFAHVRMLAAMPMRGVTLAELGQDEVDSAVRVDTQLAAERPAPNAFVALASQEEVALDAYAIVELPLRESEAPREPGGEQPALAEMRLRTEYLESQVAELAAARASHARAEESARRALEALEIERARSNRLEHDLDKIKAAHGSEAERLELAEKTLATQRERIAQLESSTGLDETSELEAKLRERGEVVAALEAELLRRDKMVRELVARLGATEADPLPAEADDLASKLDELARLAAQQKSDLEAQAWRIAELEASAATRS